MAAAAASNDTYVVNANKHKREGSNFDDSSSVASGRSEARSEAAMYVDEEGEDIVNNSSSNRYNPELSPVVENRESTKSIKIEMPVDINIAIDAKVKFFCIYLISKLIKKIIIINNKGKRDKYRIYK